MHPAPPSAVRVAKMMKCSPWGSWPFTLSMHSMIIRWSIPKLLLPGIFSRYSLWLYMRVVYTVHSSVCFCSQLRGCSWSFNWDWASPTHEWIRCEFFYSLFLSSGNRTPGSRPYSDPVDDFLADFVRTHRVTLTQAFYVASIWFQLMHIMWWPCCLSWVSKGSHKENNSFGM